MLLLSQTVQYSIMSLVCFTPYILSYIASFFNCFLFQLLNGIDNSFLVDIRYVNGKPQCSGVDPTPSSPGEGLAPWDAMDTNVQRVALRPGGGRLPPLHPVRLTVNPM